MKAKPLKECTLKLTKSQINNLLDSDVLLIGGIKWYKDVVVTEAIVEYAKKKIQELPTDDQGDHWEKDVCGKCESCKGIFSESEQSAIMYENQIDIKDCRYFKRERSSQSLSTVARIADIIDSTVWIHEDGVDETKAYHEQSDILKAAHMIRAIPSTGDEKAKNMLELFSKYNTDDADELKILNTKIKELI